MEISYRIGRPGFLKLDFLNPNRQKDNSVIIRYDTEDITVKCILVDLKSQKLQDFGEANQGRIQKISEGVAITIERRFSNRIQGARTPLFSFLPRKN